MRIIAVVSLLTFVLPAQQVTVNGSPYHVNVPVLSTVTVQLTGPAGVPHYWGFSTAPGPSSLFGTSVPIGITPDIVDLGMGAPMSAGGVRSWAASVPADPALIDLTVYTAGLFLDPAAPGGIAVTNGGLFTIRGIADAGPDTATFVNEGVVLSGAGNRDPFTGQLPPGTTFQWTVDAGPPGANTTIVNDQGEFPSFITDTPGLYTIQASVNGPASVGTDTCDVWVYDFQWNRDATGDFTTGITGVAGTVQGPPGWSVTVDGSPVGTTFQSLWLGSPTSLSGTMTTMVAELTTPGGQKLRLPRPVTLGVANSLAVPVSLSAGVRLRDQGLNGLEPLIETELAALDYNSIVTSVGTINAVGGAPFFSADITPTSGSLDVNNIQFELTADNGHVDIAVTFQNINVNVDVTGVVVFVPYTEQASITASSATMTGDLTFVPGPNGALEIQIANANATLNNFNFSISSFLNGLVQLGLIQDAIRDTVEDSLEATVGDIVAFVNPLLADFAFSLDLTQYGLPVQVDFPMEVATYDTDGVSLCNTSRALPLAAGPESPPLNRYRATPATNLTYPSVTPGGGVPYGFALCLNDDMLNQLLAAFVASGSLDLDVTGTLGTGPQAVTMNAGFFSVLVPGFGFEKFDPMTPLLLKLRHINAPVVDFTPNGMDHGTIHIGGVRMDIDAEVSPGVFLPVASVSVSGSANVSLEVAPGTTDVSLTIDDNSIATNFIARKEMAGTNPGPTLPALSFLMPFLLPAIVEPVAMVTIPAPPLGAVSVLEVSGSTAWSDYLCAYFNVQ